MGKKFSIRSKRLFKWLFLVVVIILIITAGIIGYFTKKASGLLSQKLKELVVQSSDSLYHIEFSKLSINPVTGDISLKGFKLIPDTVVYEHLKSLNRAPKNVFTLSVPQMQLRHAHLLKMLLHREARINDVQFKNPVVSILHDTLFRTDTTESIEKTMAKLISGPLHSIRIDRMDLKNITLSYKNSGDSTGRGFVLPNVDIILTDFYIDTTSIKDTSRIFYAKGLSLHLGNFKMLTTDSLYSIGLKDLVYSEEQQSIFIKGLFVEPRYKKAAFDRKVGHQQDRFDVKIDSVSASGVNIFTIIRKKELGRIQKLEMSHADIGIYRNRSLPPKRGVKPFPQQMLNKAATTFVAKNIALVFTIDTASIEHANIAYSELNPKSRRIGTVTFEQINSNFYHVTNDSDMLAKDNHCTADFHTLFMGKEKAQAHFDFNLTDRRKSFSYRGSLGYMKATELNKAIRNLGLVIIKSGNIHQIHFKFSGNEHQSTGSVSLLYDDLSVKLMERDESSGKLQKKGLASLFANLLVLHSNNTADPAALKTTKVTYQRDPQKSILNMMWKSLFEGIKKIVGMD